MKKFAILVGLMVLALVIGVTGTTFRADKAAAKPTSVISFNPDICSSFTHLGGGVCYKLDNSQNLQAVADALDGAVDDPSTYDDLVNASANQLGEGAQRPFVGPATYTPNSQSMWVLTFVSNTNPITEDADEGVWLSTGALNPKSTVTGCPLDPGNAGAADLDCNGLGVKGDGVVADLLWSGVAPTDTANFLDRGDATITVDQGTSGEETLDYTVVGVPDDLSLTALKTTIQESSGAPCVIGGYSTNEFTQENMLPDATGLLAKVVDDDGTALTGILVAWSTADDSDVGLAVDSVHGTGYLSPTLAKDKVVAAPNVGCGNDTDDAVKIRAGVDNDADGIIETGAIDDQVDLAVVDAPDSLTLKADPATIACDGVTNSVVSATVLGKGGDPVVSGNAVRFDVVALGTADKIVAMTDDKGVASSKITPLSGPLAGVTVLVTVGETSCTKASDFPQSNCEWDTLAAQGVSGTADERLVDPVNSNPCWNPCVRETNTATDVEGSILVNCQQAAPTVAPPPPVAPTVPPIRGPNTGDGGYLP